MPPTKKEKLLKKCPDCDYSSYHVSKFLEHRRVHTGTKPYRFASGRCLVHNVVYYMFCVLFFFSIFSDCLLDIAFNKTNFAAADNDLF